jgi:thiamine pyrophosphate-dependent acetolactate synthase large subunit-like protein
MRLLAEYGVSKIFGTPSVLGLDLCRDLSVAGDLGDTDSAPAPAVTHIEARNEQGAGFMAEGWCRATGQVGVAVVISGPGVTNAATALGQCYADSLPMLLISAEPPSNSIGKGRGVLHEITAQKKVTEPLTALSATAWRASDVPELLARAFSIFASQRPRPVHISLPLDVQAELVEGGWTAIRLPRAAEPAAGLLPTAAAMLKEAKRPVIMIGGGAVDAAGGLATVVERTGAVVISSTAGKGIIPDTHPRHLTGGTVRPEVRAYLATADCILAVGTELAETDSYVERMHITDNLIRVDIDPHKMYDFYPAGLPIVGDAAPAMADLAAYMSDHDSRAVRSAAEAEVTRIRAEITTNLTPSELQQAKFLNILRAAAPKETVFAGDACPLVYTGAFAFDVPKPRKWFYPAGYCARGNALPNAIGAKAARPQIPVVVLTAAGGAMITLNELMVAAERGLSLPIIVWEKDTPAQIQTEEGAITALIPDFALLAQACHCASSTPTCEEEFRSALKTALAAKRPTLITIRENDAWLLN